MKKITLLTLTSVSAILLSGCGSSTLDVPTPNNSFSYSRGDSNSKNGNIMINANQFQKSTGKFSRPRIHTKLDNNKKINEGSQNVSIFRKTAGKAIVEAKAKTPLNNSYSHTVKMIVNGSSDNGFAGFCLKSRGSSEKISGNGFDSDYQIMWNLKHCYAPDFNAGSIVGFTEYDQSVCGEYEPNLIWTNPFNAYLGTQKCSKLGDTRKSSNGKVLSKCVRRGYSKGEGISCWNLGKYSKDRINKRYAGVTVPEFTKFIGHFNESFKKKLTAEAK